jgi:hypothetical protein
MYGLMTEEINHSYDGGLYGELVQNRALLDDAKTPSHYAAVQSGSSAATIALDPKQRWTLNGRIGHCAGALIVHYPTKMEPELDALAILADRFPALIFTLRYYEVHHGLRGYAIYGPSRAWRTCQEEHVDVASETRLFPRHYPGSVAWTETAAVKSKIKFRPQLK